MFGDELTRLIIKNWPDDTTTPDWQQLRWAIRYATDRWTVQRVSHRFQHGPMVRMIAQSPWEALTT